MIHLTSPVLKIYLEIHTEHYFILSIYNSAYLLLIVRTSFRDVVLSSVGVKIWNSEKRCTQVPCGEDKKKVLCCTMQKCFYHDMWIDKFKLIFSKLCHTQETDGGR